MIAIFLLILLFRWPILYHPPLPEQARGVWFEAAFLVRTNFDIVAFRSVEPDELTGGASAYPESLLPWIIALIMRATPSPTSAFVTYRLIMFLCAAVTTSSIYDLLRKRMSGLTAGAAVATILTIPTYSTQIDLLGMDLPMVMFLCFHAPNSRTETHFAHLYSRHARLSSNSAD